MKKIAGILVLFLIALAFVGCQPSAESAEPAVFSEEKVIEDLNITNYSYRYTVSGESLFVECYEIENTSAFNITISVEYHFYDEAGDLVSVRTSKDEGIGPGQKTVFVYHQEKPYSACELKLSVTLDTEHISAASDFSYEVAVAGDTPIISLTNNSVHAAHSVSALILYFNGDQCVGFDSRGFFDADHEFKAGKTITREYSPVDVEFDSYRVYLQGQTKQ